MKTYFAHDRAIVLLSCILLICFSATHAQEKAAIRYQSNVEPQFQQGVALFNAGRYEEALNVFEGLLREGYRHQRLTAVLYMRARCAYYLGRYETATVTLEELIRSFPRSVYVEHAHALLGMITFQKEEYPDAAVEFLRTVETTRNAALRQQATQWARIALGDYVALGDLRHLRKTYSGTSGLPLIVMALARAEIKAGNRQAGQKVIEEFLRANPNTALRNELEKILAAAEEPATQVCRIGVVLPLSGFNAEAGMGVYRGIKYAQLAGSTNATGNARKNAEASGKIEFVVRDSESDILRALKATQELLADPKVVAIIGEVENSISAAIAALADARGVPLLVPVATENGIGALGRHVIQLNADREAKSRALAEYAYNVLNARTFVTISPQDDYGEQMTDGFSAAIDSLGGVILAQKWYYGEPQDLGRNFKAIREAAFRKALEDSLRTNGKTLTKIELNALWRSYNYRFTTTRGQKENLVEMLAIPVTNVDAIFLPLHEEDIKLVATQRAYFNIQSIILGGENWYLADLEKNKELQRYVDNAVFASDYYIDPESNRYKQFRNDFRTRLGATPGKWEIFGYDAASFILQVIHHDACSREQLQQALGEAGEFRGMKGSVDLRDSDRVNSKVNLLQIRGTQIVKLR
jgi:ABC-type branched-subunit amino acid transport system substrate-binding protein